MPAELRSQQDDMETRFYVAQDLRVEGGQGEKEQIVGYAAVFNQYSQDLGGFREMIMPGAFTESIQLDDIRALWNHDAKYVLGRNKSGTLALGEDPQGLSIAIEPPATQWARDLLVSIDRGDISQMSFGFYTIKDEWHQDSEGVVTRKLIQAQLFDVSPVTFPAYPQTSAQVRDVLLGLQDGTVKFAGGQVAAADGSHRDKTQARLSRMRLRINIEEQKLIKRGK